MRVIFPVGISIMLVSPCFAFEAKLQVEIPQLRVAEYHRPYLAAWIEGAERRVITNLALWYEVNNPKQEGDKWLKDLRQWWRRIGRELTVPIDGVTGPTRPPGTHVLDVAAPLADLPEGEYNLVVEAAREEGGRELLRLPFAWPLTSPATLKADGQTELGTIIVELRP